MKKGLVGISVISSVFCTLIAFGMILGFLFPDLCSVNPIIVEISGDLSRRSYC